MYYKRKICTSIYVTIDGEAFVIIIKVIKRKFEKQKCASLNWSVY